MGNYSVDSKRKIVIIISITMLWILRLSSAIDDSVATTEENLCDNELINSINDKLDIDDYALIDGVKIQRNVPFVNQTNSLLFLNETSKKCKSVPEKITEFAEDHHISVNLTQVIRPVGRFLQKSIPRLNFGKNSFLTGFGLGFLAFGLKKLLLPIFIGAQIIKSILIAMFLPSILGSVGKLVGKGVTTFAQSSGSSNLVNGGGDNVNDFDFKDTAATNNNYDSEPAGSEYGYNGVWTYPGADAQSNSMLQFPDISHYLQQYALPTASNPTLVPSANLNSISSSPYLAALQNEYMKPTFSTKYTPPKGKDSVPSDKYYSGSFYSKDKSEDFKVFHNIPSSSHLLANYDPFYSPLLSRMDSVFQQLSYSTEPCRERLVCNMYRNPAKYAPFSNLVSAQLSRELNELRKPSSDNPEILRFFRYMKAAKDGQDGQECEVIYSECVTARGPSENTPMVATFNDINKLVQARSLK